MTVTNRRTPTLRHTIAALLAASMLAGCASGGGGGGLASAGRADKSASQARKALAKGQVSKAVALAEAAVAKSPRDAALRTTLARAYLQAGRFKSAVTTFDDAMELGDNSPRTALALTLALIADDQPSEALAILEDWKGDIPVADQGLALALAGEAARGVALLSDALRQGENTPKLRQNLAYAYALDGRWRDARLMASQDVPAGELDSRITEWAQSAAPDARRLRVAAMLGVPLRDDPGQPASLALVSTPNAVQLAAQEAAPAAEPESMVTAVAAEAPAVAPVVEVAVVAPAPAPAPLPVAEPAAVAIAEFASVLPPVEPAPLPAAVVPAMVTAPVQAAAQPVAAPSPAPRAIASRTVTNKPIPALVRAAKPRVTNGSHLVQLGSFASEQGARRAWGIYTARNPMLKDYAMTIIPVVVNGKNYWRVAAAGFTPGDARSLCGTLRRKGGACFAYATPKSAVPAPGVRYAGMVQRARRR
jgi:Flp pilus assembly protein TadD